VRERKGPLGRAAGLAGGVAAAARRRQQDREPRVVIYDGAGHSRLLASDAPGYFELLDTCERMISLAAEARAATSRREAPPSDETGPAEGSREAGGESGEGVERSGEAGGESAGRGG
jgi:hypothetical protein